VLSNLIWPLKTNIDVGLLDRVLSPAITLYAFVTDASSSSPQYLHPIFPGQLLITGTVFVPVLVIVLLAAVLGSSIYLANLLKSYLIRHDLADFGVSVSLGPGKPVLQFRCLNAATVGVTTSLIASVIYDLVKTVVIRSSSLSS